MVDEQPETGVEAITTLLAVLGPLKPETRVNVLDFVFRTLKIAPPSAPNAAALTSLTGVVPPGASFVPPPALVGTTATDLRSLREQKHPTSANQMVAVLAYYLESLAPTEERRSYIVPEDIKRYFPQANFALPVGSHGQILINAKNAGYLDTAGAGQYKLTPVGHNLVLHKLPRGGDSSQSGRASRKPARKAAKKKKGTK